MRVEHSAKDPLYVSLNRTGICVGVPDPVSIFYDFSCLSGQLLVGSARTRRLVGPSGGFSLDIWRHSDSTAILRVRRTLSGEISDRKV